MSLNAFWRGCTGNYFSWDPTPTGPWRRQIGTDDRDFLPFPSLLAFAVCHFASRSFTSPLLGFLRRFVYPFILSSLSPLYPFFIPTLSRNHCPCVTNPSPFQLELCGGTSGGGLRPDVGLPHPAVHLFLANG